jgi:hypothetical protein
MKKKIITIITLILLITSITTSVFAETNEECLAKLLWGEARGIPSMTEKAAVVWVVMNRVDDPRFPGNIQAVVKAPNQFVGYNYYNPVDPTLAMIARDVMWRWTIEKQGRTDSGRVIPRNFYYFTGSGGKNWFRQEYWSSWYWNWTLKTPYAS